MVIVNTSIIEGKPCILQTPLPLTDLTPLQGQLLTLLPGLACDHGEEEVVWGVKARFYAILYLTMELWRVDTAFIMSGRWTSQ
jgi:hypothetical protein